jgi:MSHA biogenesis protein MshJ
VKVFMQAQAKRIDALSLRERAIMFVSLAVALVAAADALVISPRLAEQKALLAQRQAQTVQINALRTTLAGGGAEADTPSARLARQLTEGRARQQALDAEIAHGLAQGARGARLPDLLERVLRRYDRLTLLRLATVQPTGNAAAQALDNALAKADAALPLQGVEIVVRGSYIDLAQYVADTESALPALRWGPLSITGGSELPVLTARVYLLGAAP